MYSTKAVEKKKSKPEKYITAMICHLLKTSDFIRHIWAEHMF